MRLTVFPSIDDMKMRGVKKLNFIVVDSKFNVLKALDNVPTNIWRKTYTDLYESNQTKERFSKFIIIYDCDENILYCSKIKTT